ncbi:MAG: hypothetical protein K2Q10_10900, partial [Rhodospirillales bacterium]|nr:hypothetical protein [Rhodospirillales bacterium]
RGVDARQAHTGIQGARIVAAEVLPGRTKVTGSMSCFVENSDLLKGYIDEDELALHMVINAPGGTGDFFALHIPRLKFTSGSLKGQGEQTLPVDLQFQAMLKADGGAGTGFDKTTIAFQVSN